MRFAHVATAAAATALLAGAAMAQSTPMSSQPMPMPSEPTPSEPMRQPAPGMPQRGDMPMDGQSMQSSTMPMQNGAMAADMAGQNASMTPPMMSASGAQIVSNGPVPDTAETRRMYRPLSNAGRRTAAQGN